MLRLVFFHFSSVTPPTCSLSPSLTHFTTQLPKMAAASSIQPPTVHSVVVGESALYTEMDSPESRQPEDEEVSAAQPSDSSSGISLRDLPDLEPEEIERRLAKTRQELSNRRKILIKNLPPDTTNQVLCAGELGVAGFSLVSGFTHSQSLGLLYTNLSSLQAINVRGFRKPLSEVEERFFFFTMKGQTFSDS